jgi:hypothetical protein
MTEWAEVSGLNAPSVMAVTVLMTSVRRHRLDFCPVFGSE